MLVLRRKTNQDILMPQHDIIIRVLEIKGQRVSLGIEAPGSVKILRAEVYMDSHAESGPYSEAGGEDRIPASSFHPHGHIPAN